ncbi:hypothetical protein [Kitasatospora sp. NPDC017646]|uniref:hypothetical protein n=1 Tax=Kitasatospora sp. NPDC017646 TaxID=3364024 RepID=UPI0037A7F220
MADLDSDPRSGRPAVRFAKRLAPGHRIEVVALAWAVVCRWWDLALEWPDERVWPARRHALASGDASGDFWRSRAVARDAAVFPEVVAVARALLDPVMADLVWQASGAGRPRCLPRPGRHRRVGRWAVRMHPRWCRLQHIDDESVAAAAV